MHTDYRVRQKAKGKGRADARFFRLEPCAFRLIRLIRVNLWLNSYLFYKDSIRASSLASISNSLFPSTGLFKKHRIPILSALSVSVFSL